MRKENLDGGTNEEEDGQQQQDDVTPGPSCAGWSTVMRRSLDKERRRREIIVAGLELSDTKRNMAGKDWCSTFSKADAEVNDLLLHLQERTGVNSNGNYSWKHIGKANANGQRLIKITFETDVIVDRFLAYARCLQHAISADEGDDPPRDYSNVYLRRSLSKEEREKAFLDRQAKRLESKRSSA